ncbi:substrate-binding domain-containing protein [Streptomyces althioticus]|uniref:substrate-binding domain-containing protein n=1 Tax=Streptomyces althioticus TaxID=83380 RepID=UPI0036D00532
MAPGDFRPESGHAACHTLLDLPEPPAAIFAAGDRMARGAVEALRGRRLRVPQNMTAVGFDDLREATRVAPYRDRHAVLHDRPGSAAARRQPRHRTPLGGRGTPHHPPRRRGTPGGRRP